MLMLVLIFAAGLWAGLQNALAGGGSFVTLPALIMSGMSPLAANITSTVALFPGQVTSGLAGRSLVTGAGRLPFKALFGISVVGGALGGLLLLNTPSSIFSRLVPWLVLFATAMFAWGSFRRKPANLAAAQIGPVPTGIAQFFIAIYGGYFGGGIGFLMMAALSMAGVLLTDSPWHGVSVPQPSGGRSLPGMPAIFLFTLSRHAMMAPLSPPGEHPS